MLPQKTYSVEGLEPYVAWRTIKSNAAFLPLNTVIFEKWKWKVQQGELIDSMALGWETTLRKRLLGNQLDLSSAKPIHLTANKKKWKSQEEQPWDSGFSAIK